MSHSQKQRPMPLFKNISEYYSKFLESRLGARSAISKSVTDLLATSTNLKETYKSSYIDRDLREYCIL
jgi:hypothetical protein